MSGSEPEFYFDDGSVVGAREVSQTEAHRLIEHLMILRNEQVAKLLEHRQVPTSIASTRSLTRSASPASSSSSTRSGSRLAAARQVRPERGGRAGRRSQPPVAAEAKRRGHGREAYTTLVLRALQQAYYSASATSATPG